MPGFTVLYYVPEFAQTHVHWVSDAIHPSYPLPFSSCLQSFPAPGSFLMSQVFTSGDPGIGASASASVLLVNIQGCFPLTLTGGLISLLAKDSQESSPALQLENISSSALHLPYGPAFISVPDCWETTAFIIQTFVSKVMPLLFSICLGLSQLFFLASIF